MQGLWFTILRDVAIDLFSRGGAQKLWQQRSEAVIYAAKWRKAEAVTGGSGWFTGFTASKLTSGVQVEGWNKTVVVIHLYRKAVGLKAEK